MKQIADLLFEASFLKQIRRTGYQYLGAGQESVAEHVYAATFIGFVLARLEPRADAGKLISMCLVHDFPEARIGDLNYVQKKYVRADESVALHDAIEPLPPDNGIGDEMGGLIDEFNEAETLEARLAHDADQLALLIDLKFLSDTGYKTPSTWIPPVKKRLKTKVAIELATAIMTSSKDDWWLKKFVDSNKVIP
jgi:putative hydrolase of HD superfamily